MNDEHDMPQDGAAAPADASLPAIRSALDTLTRDLESAISEAGKGADIVLDGLDIRVSAACAAVEQLPAAEGRSLEPRLLALIETLDRLAETITPPPAVDVGDAENGGETEQGGS